MGKNCKIIQWLKNITYDKKQIQIIDRKTQKSLSPNKEIGKNHFGFEIETKK